MSKTLNISVQLLLSIFTVGFLSHHLFIFIPQQILLLSTISQFSETFGTLYRIQQLSIIKVILVPWFIEFTLGIIAMKDHKINTLQKYLKISNLALILISIACITIDVTFALILMNGYHVFAFNTSKILHWVLLTIWIIRSIFIILQIKSCKNSN